MRNPNCRLADYFKDATYDRKVRYCQVNCSLDCAEPYMPNKGIVCPENHAFLYDLKTWELGKCSTCACSH